MIRICDECGQKNRIPLKRLASRGRCGACRARLAPLAEPLDVGDAEFKEIVDNVKVPVLVDFWAAWCGPCRMAAPEVKKVAKKLAGKALVLKVNTEEHPDLASRFDVRGIPNFVVLKDGELVLQQPGLVKSHQMERWLKDAA